MNKLHRLILGFMVLSMVIVASVSAETTAVNPITRLSVAFDGSEANNGSQNVSASTDGRYVVFTSWATNLVPDDTNGQIDVFFRDTWTNEVKRISIASDGTQGNGLSEHGSISADGRYVVFDSEASNLVPNDTNGETDVFWHDMDTGQTERISLAYDGAEGNGDSYGKISADGRYVVIYSYAYNLVPTDTNYDRDVFLYERATNQLRLVSLGSNGQQASSGSTGLTISGDGHYVAFYSSDNLVPQDTNPYADIYVRDTVANQTVLASIGTNGEQATNYVTNPSLSADGRFVTFESYTAFVPEDTNNLSDVYLRDMVANQTYRVSVASDNSQGDGNSSMAQMSADGSWVVFESTSSFVPNNTYTPIIYLHHVWTNQTIVASVNMANEPQGISWFPSISPNGRYVYFASSSEQFVPGDTNSQTDLFQFDRQLASYIHTIYLPLMQQ